MDPIEKEDDDIFIPEATANDLALYNEVMREKESHPSEFVSYWEMDDQVSEATQEEIDSNPVLKMLWAAEKDQKDVIDELLEQDAELVNCKDDDGYTPLHRAAYCNHTNIAQVLIEKGADVGARTDDGWTPLHSASFWNNVSVAELLLAAGSNINAQTNGKQTPLHLAASQPDHKNIIALLLTNPAIDATLKNQVGETALEICRRISNLSYLFDIVDPSISRLDPESGSS
ncbi:ankyrin repeat domain-containing protein 49-like [Tubulanus polymorphus]|uniref:ankyrin repeat domain-containing protein 49-like n=1 Tax=Tubulanus polymorphus TaxID=672921 RepID=UPI003DA31F4B